MSYRHEHQPLSSGLGYGPTNPPGYPPGPSLFDPPPPPVRNRNLAPSMPPRPFGYQDYFNRPSQPPPPYYNQDPYYDSGCSPLLATCLASLCCCCLLNRP